MRKIVLSIFAILLLSFTMSAQNLRISGTVTDQEGGSIPFAKVSVVGTTVVAYADLDGNFEITAPGNGSLEFSAEQMETKVVRINNNTIVNVTLGPSATMLTEFILTGYGSAREAGSVSGSVTKVGEEIIGKSPTASAADALQGQVPGMNVASGSGEPYSSATMIIHGVGSINAGSAPLVIIDGMQTGLGLSSINPADIETIITLKDASATAIYGARAANGVIFVTTKRGKRNQDAIITYSAQYGISTPARSKTSYMGAQDLLDFQLQFNEISLTEYNEFGANLQTYGESDFFRFAYDDAPYFNMDLSVAGGSNNTSYFLSGGYMNQDGMATNSKLERYTFRSNFDSQIKSWASMGANVGLIYSKSSATFDSSGAAYIEHPSWFAILTPSYFPLPIDNNGDNLPSIRELNNMPNPRYYAEKHPSGQETYRYNVGSYLNINPIKGLNIKSSIAASGSFLLYESRALPSNELSTYTGISRSAYATYQIVNSNTAEYKFNIQRTHNLSFLVGHEGILSKMNDFSATKTALVDDRFTQLDNATSIEPTDVGDGFSRTKFISFFGLATYNYKDKYFLDASIRTDGSSRFGEGNRYATFYSLGAVWNLKKEEFLKNVNTISELRVRMNYGTQGNSSIDDYMTYPLIVNSATNYAQNAVYYISASAGNDNLRWETSKQFTAAFDISLWNRLNISASYWHKFTDDMLYRVSLAPSSGFQYQMQNVAAMVNQGVELELGGVIYQNRDWLVSASTVFSYQTSEITKLYDDVTKIPLSFSVYQVGQPLGVFYIEESMGIDPQDGRMMWNDGNGNPVKNYALAKQMIQENKNYMAPYFGGFNFLASWKGIEFTASLSYSLGKYAMNYEDLFLTNLTLTRYNRKADMLDNVWTTPGDETKYPRYGTSQAWGTHLLQDASYLRVKNLQVSYTLPRKWIDKTGAITSVRVYFTGRNLFTITPYTGADPEPIAQILGGQYPNTRQYLGGIEIKF